MLAGAGSDPRQQVMAGRFRQDLLYRLAVVEFRAAAACASGARTSRTWSRCSSRTPAARPGQAAHRAGARCRGDAAVGPVARPRARTAERRRAGLSLAEGPVVSARDVAGAVPARPLDGAAPCRTTADDGRPLSTVERDHIVRALQRAGGNKKAAARMLGVSRRALYRKLERLDLGDDHQPAASRRGWAVRVGFDSRPPARVGVAQVGQVTPSPPPRDTRRSAGGDAPSAAVDLARTGWSLGCSRFRRSRPSFILRLLRRKAGTPCPPKSSPSWASKRTASINVVARLLEPHHGLPRTSRPSAAAKGSSPHLGPLVCRTGHHTGRSPNDKFVVKEPSSADEIWWGKVNRPIEPENFDAAARSSSLSYMEGKDLFVQDCYAGADPAYRLPIRVITENAWHSLFARHMFIPERDRAKLRAPPAAVHGDRLPAVPRRPRGARHELRGLHHAELRAGARADRRHQLRRRDQEVDLHRDELPAAAAAA